MKTKLLAFFCILLLLTGCTVQISPAESSSTPESSTASSPSPTTEQSQPPSQAPLGREDIPCELIGDYWLEATSTRILVMGGNGIGFFSPCITDGQWVLVNGSIWDDQGNLLREFLSMQENPDPQTGWATLSDGRVVERREDANWVSSAHWISDDLLAINCLSRLFLYRISTDNLTLVEDMYDWMQQFGREQVYYGVRDIMPTDDQKGCYYFAHKNARKSNTVGSIWYADETGTKALFNEQEFSRVFYQDGMLVMLHWERQTLGEVTATHIWYSRDGETLHKLAELEGSFTPDSNITQGYIKLSNLENKVYIINSEDISRSGFQP